LDSTGSTLRGACVCDPGFVGNLSVLAQTCAACPANSYCGGLSQLACPANTRSPALSSLAVHCRCVAGYRCSYRRDARLDFRFNLDQNTFTSQDPAIRAKLAVAADVPTSSVALVSAQAVAGV
jgi:hypothetical protein